MTPKRIQLSRAKGWRMPPNTLKVSRPSKWGNPFNATQVGVVLPPMFNIIYLRQPPSLDRCIDLYIAWLYSQLRADRDFVEPLRGHNLACWCPLDKPCHADVLLDLANR